MESPDSHKSTLQKAESGKFDCGLSPKLIETERLILREVDPVHDFEGWAATFGDPDTVQYLGIEPMTRQQAWRSMAVIIGHWAIRGYGFFSVIEKASGKWAGRIGHWYPEGWPQPEVGWTLHPDFRGKGYALEAGSACIDYAFQKLDWPEVVHLIAPENTASIRVAEKLGSSFIRKIDCIPGFYDKPCLIYGQKRS